MKNLNLKNSQLAFAILLACAGQASATDYWFRSFNLPPDALYANSGDINDAGLGVVTITGGTLDLSTYTAATWGGTYTYLDKAGKESNIAYKINNQGTVVGSAGAWIYDPEWGRTLATKPVVWANGVATFLPLLGSGNYSGGVGGINNAGVIVGASTGADGHSHAVKWVNNSLIDLGTAGRASAYAYSINDNGQIVGSSNSAFGYSTAILWENGTAIDLGAQAGITRESSAYDINNAGVVLGWQQSLTGYDRLPTVWHDGVATQLGSLGYGASGATAINDAGTVVGFSRAADGLNHAVMWSDGQVIDLNAYLDPGLRADGWVLINSEDINSRGDIVGDMTNSRLGKTTAYMLTVSTVPEPETYAMMLSGVGLLAFAARRRKGRQS